MGILDNKSRIMDVIVTKEGRRQLGRNQFKPMFASFSDKNVFYEADIVSGSSDATLRIQFEAANLPVDQVILEYDDSGKLMGSPDPKVQSIGTGIFETADSGETNLATGNDLIDAANKLVSSSFTNLRAHSLLTSNNTSITEDNKFNFSISKNSIDFLVNNIIPFRSHPNKNIVDLDDVETLLFDRRVNHIPNFKFLPPLRKDGIKLGNYFDLNQSETLTFQDLMKELGSLPVDDNDQSDTRSVDMFGPVEESFLNSIKDVMNQRNSRPSKTIKFESTTDSNNLLCQVFEIKNESNNSSFRKLNVIDFGTFIDKSDVNRQEKHVFFVGKIEANSYKILNFTNLFTLIFD